MALIYRKTAAWCYGNIMKDDDKEVNSDWFVMKWKYKVKRDDMESGIVIRKHGEKRDDMKEKKNRPTQTIEEW